MKAHGREKGRFNLFVPMIVIFCLMVVMVLYTRNGRGQDLRRGSAA